MEFGMVKDEFSSDDESQNPDNRPPYTPSAEEIREKWSSIIVFISRTIQLRVLVFDCREQIPVMLLEAVQNEHPSCRLHVRNWTRLRPDVKVGDLSEEALARSPCLRSIQAVLGVGSRRMNLNVAAFQRVISLSPNLEQISYKARYGRGGRIGIYYIHESLEEEISAFSVEHPARKDIKFISWQSMNLETIQSWERFMNFNAISTLDLGWVEDKEVFEYIGSHQVFGSIKYLSFRIERRFPEYKQAVTHCLSSLPALESLAIINYYHVIDLESLLSSHGESLRSLSLHQIEFPNRSRAVPTLDQLRLVRSSAPNLETLEFDLDRETEEEFYKVLASFPDLRTLTIFYDLGVPLRYAKSGRLLQAAWSYEPLSEEFGRQVYKTVRNFQDKCGGIKELNLIVGEPRREEEASSRGFWVNSERKVKYKLHVVTKGDDLGDISVHIVPPAQVDRED
ncbi:hypothetical protein L218DRAFT_1008242 [Marasmius fiardii PR-910]|nr:hypothetical protein L218DRAFT_1008242 [Marasmius fiardii PR-910]